MNGMSVGILVVGNEILDGLVLDTNTNWIQKRLTSMGIITRRVVTVRDDITEIVSGLAFILEVCNVAITSGGLGPTHDDLTLAGVAKFCGVNLVEHPVAAEIVKRQYRILYERGLVDTPDYIDSRRKMAMLPGGATPIDNSVGGAPGIVLKREQKTIICLPGVPAELKAMFDAHVTGLLATGEGYFETVVRLGASDETVLAPAIHDVMTQYPGVYIKSMPRPYGTSDTIRVWVSARCDTTERSRSLVQEAISALARRTGALVESDDA
ncbi:MAG: molybdopterin-binding protein [Candidatus Thorarchaeota archaeon]